LPWKKDPFRVKHWHKMWGKFDPPPFGLGYSYRQREAVNLHYPNYPYYVLDTEPGAYISLEEQQEEAANLLLELGLFEFMLRPSLQEGAVSSTVSKVTIAEFIQDKATGEYRFPDQDVVAGVRSLLEATAGMPVQTLLAQQDALIPKAQALPRPKTPDSRQPSTNKAATAHPPLPPRRHRITPRTG
jgi:hypothetical protein